MTSVVNDVINQIQEYKIPSIIPRHFRDVLRHNDKGRVVLITMVISLVTIMPVGYNMVVLNVPEKIIQQSINESLVTMFNVNLGPSAMSVVWSVIVSCQALGALIGCLLVGPIFTRFGAKSGMMLVNNMMLVMASTIMFSSFALNMAAFLLLGRLLSGVHTGIACSLLPLYIQQIAPKDIKGSLSCFLHIAVCFGSALGAIFSLDFMLGSSDTWGYLLGIPAVLGLLEMIADMFVPDTPNHLLQRGRYLEAIKSIKFYYDIDEIDEDETIKSYWDMVPEVPEQTPWLRALQEPKVVQGVLLGMAVSATQVFSGSMATISYSSSMFEAVSFIDVLVPFLPALGSIISMVLTVPAFQLVESSGRRPLLLSTLVICIVADSLLLIFSLISSDPNASWASWGFAVSFFIYGIGYNLGTGPVSYFIAAELVPPDAASISLGAAVATNWLCSLITTFSYYPIMMAVGGWSYLLFIIPTSVLLLVLWRWLPETKYYYRNNDLETRLFQDLGRPYGSMEACIF